MASIRKRSRRVLFAPLATLVVLAVTLVPACGGDDSAAAESANAEVVLYSSIDEPDLRGVIDRFEKGSGMHVRVVTDTEATKTTALAERIEAEKDHPQADVYWGNEVFHTIDLAEKGVFAPYRPKTAEDVPAKWRDPKDRYTGLGVRARTLAFSTRPEDADIAAELHGMKDLTDPALRDRLGFCHPGFGTASGHFAALLVEWGDDAYRQWLQKLADNHAKLLGGNAAVTEQIGAGHLVAGTADNDDVDEAKEEGLPVGGRLPDQGEGEIGTLLIPGTVALVAGAPHPEAAKRLIDALCKPEVEQELIDGGYLAWSVRDTIPADVKAMDVDYSQVAHRMREAVETALSILQHR